MKKTIIVALAALTTTAVKADTIGLYLGGHVWSNQVTGILGESGNQVDVNLQDEKQGSYFIAVEHPLPLIPNFKLGHTSLKTNGNTTLTSDIEFGNETFTTSSDINADFNVSYTDYTLYYEFFDNGLFSFDLGITGRDFDGDVKFMTNASQTPAISGTVTTDEIIPMLYVSTHLGIPSTPLNVFAEGNFLSVGDHALYDYQVGVSYEVLDNIAVDFNLTLGYRAVELKLDDLNGLYSDLEFNGVFAGAIVHF